MSMNAIGRDINALIEVKGAGYGTATAGGAGDNTEVNGTTIDMTTFTNRPESLSFVVYARAVLAQDATLTVTANLQASSDGSTWADVAVPAVIGTLTGGTGGSTEVGTFKLGVDLTHNLQYARIQFTPDLSAGGTDTSTCAVVCVAGGLDRIG